MSDLALLGNSFLPSERAASGWASLAGCRWQFHYIGSAEVAKQILNWLEIAGDEPDAAALSQFLVPLPNDWAFIAVSSGYRVAATDKVRSYPLFFSSRRFPCLISPSARAIQELTTSPFAEGAALIEFMLAGYVTGRDTLLADIKQLQAGDLLLVPAKGDGLQLLRYYRYLPRPEERTAAEWIDDLAQTTEGIFKRMIESAQGRPLLVPLSGGLDSRLIVCMLRYLGYDNVRTFSYGLPNNHEAKIAAQVAETAGFPWEFVPTSHSGFREFFWSAERKDFWELADGFSSIPTMQDVHPLKELRERGLSDDTIVVNGQSGDFISGGHIPASLLKAGGREALLDAVLNKHFALRKSLRTPANLAAVSERISKSFREIELAAGHPLSPAAIYESWEWQERQCKYVIGGQRVYDWLGLNWRLPLWDADYLEFWSRVPFEVKLGQGLYKEFLRSRDYCGLFKNFNPTVWRWPGATIAAVPVAQVVGLLGGRRTKDCFYDYARYIGHYGSYYAPWGWREFLRSSPDIRNPVTLFVDQWLRENGIPGSAQSGQAT